MQTCPTVQKPAPRSLGGVFRDHWNVEIDIGSKELEDHQFLRASVLHHDWLGCFGVRDKELIPPEVASLDIVTVVTPLAAPHQDVVDAIVLTGEALAWFDHQPLAAEFGGVIIYPVFFATFLLCFFDQLRRCMPVPVLPH